MVDQYAVIGNPIAHSKSPWIHAEFARVCDDVIDYGLLESEPTVEAFEASIKQFMQAGGNGLNVTMPFKEMAWALSDHLSHRAKLAGAVNTLTFTDNGDIHGDTTDGVGLVNDLTVNMGVQLEGKKLLILGAGGAVKGVIQPLLEKQPELLGIANRTVEKAEELVEVFRDYGDLSAGSYPDASSLGAFDVIINATPSNFSGELPPVSSAVFAKDSVAYDMSYAAEATVVEQWSKENGEQQVGNGLGMLVEQAAESLSLWRGRRPNTKGVLAELRKSLNVL